MSTDGPHRRDFIAGLMAFASAASMGCESLSAVEQAQSSLFLSRLLEGVELDSILEANWGLSEAIGPRAGAVILNLTHEDGRTLRIDVCRLGETPMGPVATAHLDFIVMDGGGGKSFYDNEFILALTMLADIMQQNDYPYQLSESLLSHSERLQVFPSVMSRAAHELIPTPVLESH